MTGRRGDFSRVASEAEPPVEEWADSLYVCLHTADGVWDTVAMSRHPSLWRVKDGIVRNAESITFREADGRAAVTGVMVSDDRGPICSYPVDLYVTAGVTPCFAPGDLRIAWT